MNKKIRFFIALLALIVAAGAVFVMASPTDDSHCPVSRFMGYGILPQVDSRDFDRHITFVGFAGAVHNLLGIEINEKYTFHASQMYIRHYEATRILAAAMGQPLPNNNQRDFLTLRTLAIMLDDAVQLLVRDEVALNMATTPLNGTFLINHLLSEEARELDSLITSLRGVGDVVIVPRAGSHMLLDNISIEGNIIIINGPFGPKSLTLHNVQADGLYVLGAAHLTLIGNSNVDNIHIYASASLDTIGLARGVAPPNVSIHTNDVRLAGSFGKVEVAHSTMFAPFLLPVDGSIYHLYASSNVMAIGDVEITNYAATELTIINPYGMNLGMLEMIEAMMMHFMQDLFSNMNLPPPTAPTLPTPPIITPPPADPSPAPEQ